MEIRTVISDDEYFIFILEIDKKIEAQLEKSRTNILILSVKFSSKTLGEFQEYFNRIYAWKGYNLEMTKCQLGNYDVLIRRMNQ